MRTKLRSKVTLLFLTIAVLLAVPAVALADLVEDDIVVNGNDTIGLKADSNSPTGFSGSTIVNYRIVQQGPDCEPSTGDDATVTINTPAGVTASPSTLTFNSCGASQAVTLTTTSFAANGQQVSVSVADSDASGTGAQGYNINNARFNLQVQKATQVSNVSGSATEGDTANLKATLSSLYAASENMQGKNIQFKIGTTVVGTDATDSTGLAELSGVSLPTGFTAANTYNGAVTATFDGLTDTIYVGSSGTGDLVVSPACTNPADPVFSGSPNGDNGWYKSNVPTVLATSTTSGAVVKYSDAANGTYSTTAPTLGEGTTTVYAKAFSSTGSCMSAAVSNTYKVDTIAPTINDDGTTQTPNGAGWFNTAVTNDFSASDATSGLPTSFTTPFSVSSGTDEGSAVKINSGPVSDNAGNTNPGIDSAAFKIDLSDPVVNCDSAPSGWSKNDVNIHCQASDTISGLADAADGDFDLSTSVPDGTETDDASTDDRVITDAAGRTATAGPISGIKVDKKAPVLTDEGPTTQPDGDNGWYKSAVTNGFKATDGGSGFAPNGDLTKSFTKSSGTNEGNAVKIASDVVSDAVGNSAASIDSAAFKIDLSDPTNVTFEGGPAADGSYDFGDTPDEPTCKADDAISGFASCEVTGYSTGVGSHTMTATAKDNAGRTETATRTYTVKAWTTKGFYQPVDMSTATTTVWNTVKGGSTVPLKFELFKGTTELTDTANVKPVQSTKVSCSTGAGVEDAIETVATGGTMLRYDTTGGQFIYNWKTPTGAGSCYKVTVTAQDGSTITAYFKMK